MQRRKNMSFWIVTDIASDLPADYVNQQNKLTILPMPYRLAGKEYIFHSGDENVLPAFYQSLRDGAVATTAQVNMADYQQTFRELIRNGESVLCISFSSGISGSYQAAVLAKNLITEEIPAAKLIVIDSLCVSMGLGLLLTQVFQLRAEGKSMEFVAEWVMNNRQRVNHWFTVDDLDFLHRGGRVSAASAYIGGILKIKPILHVNFEGKLIPREKVTGRKRSLKTLAQKAVELAVPKADQTFGISHGDCLEEAQFLAQCLREEIPGIGQIMISPVDAIIGAHSDPGTVALFFMGNNR